MCEEEGGRGSQCAQASPAVRLLLVLPDLKLNTEEFIFQVSKRFFGLPHCIQHHNLKLKY